MAWREPFPVPLLRLFGFGFGSMPRAGRRTSTIQLARLRKMKRKRLRSGSNWIHKTLFKQDFSQQNPLANATQKRVRFRFATVDIWHDWSPLRDEAERSQKTETLTFAC